MADKDRKRDRSDRPGQEAASEKERFADQQFGASAARDQERADRDETPTGKPKPRAGNKAEPS